MSEFEDRDGNIRPASWFRKNGQKPYRMDGLTGSQYRKLEEAERRGDPNKGSRQVTFAFGEQPIIEAIEEVIDYQFQDIRQRGTHIAVCSLSETCAAEVEELRDEMREAGIAPHQDS